MRARTLSDEKISSICRIVMERPDLTASQVADQLGENRPVVKYWLKVLRRQGTAPRWTGRDFTQSEPSQAEIKADILTRHEVWRMLDEANNRFAELMGGRSYA